MFVQILNLVGQPPGSLVYHFVILFAVEAAFAISIGQWLRERNSGTLRLSVAGFALLLARVVMLLASLAAWQGYAPRNVLLPPVERFVDAITVLGLAWAFVTMDVPDLLRRNFTADVISVAALGVIFIMFGGTYYFWTTSSPADALFNGSWLDMAWSVFQIAVAVVGLIWLVSRIRYLYDPFLKGIMLILLGAAAAVHVIWPVLGDVPAAMRVSEALVMPMFAAVSFRHVVERLLHWDEFEPSRLSQPQTAGAAASGSVIIGAPEAIAPPGMADDTVQSRPMREAAPDDEEEPAVEVEEVGPPPPLITPALLETVDAVSELLSTLEPSQIVTRAPRAVATALRADICALAIVDENVQEAAIVGGYDNISQIPLHRGELDLAAHPTIVNALGRLRQMRLTTQRNSGELRDIYSRLHITHEGPAYIQPLVNQDKRVGVLIVGSPYSERQFSEEERNLLDRLAPLVTASLLNTETYKAVQDKAERALEQESQRVMELADDMTARTAELNTARRQIDEMKEYIRDLHGQLEEFPRQQQAAQQQIDSLIDEIERLREQTADTEQLRQKLEAMRAAVTASTASAADGERAAPGEIAVLRAQLAQARVSEQEVGFLQEQLAAKAREVVMLQSRLAEAEAVADALRDRVSMSRSAAYGPSRSLDAMQERIAEQAREIAGLKADLADARAQRGQRAPSTGRHALEDLEVQLAERSALIDALEDQLATRAEAVADLKTHVAGVSRTLEALEMEISDKSGEINRLQEDLAQTHQAAQERIAVLEAALSGGKERVTRSRDQRATALEDELAERAATIGSLEEQLKSARESVGEFAEHLEATHQAVDAAISSARQVDQQDAMIGAIAQELRIPISSILGYTDLLLRESAGLLVPLQQRFLQRIKANTERLNALLSDLIRLTTLEAGHMPLEPEVIDVRQAVEESVNSLVDQLDQKALALQVDIPDGLPTIIADRTALLDIFQHLLTNAALASPVEGEVGVSVSSGRCRLPAADDAEMRCLQIAVSDSGPGVPPEDYERVFEADFEEGRPLIEGLGDSGISLLLAKSLVEAHGGTIGLQSRRGAGTTVHVWLPLEPLDEGRAGSRAS